MADLDAIRRDLEAHRDESRKRIATLAKRPERGTAQGFGKRIGDGTVEAISRLTEIGVGTSLEVGLERTERALAKLDEAGIGKPTFDAAGNLTGVVVSRSAHDAGSFRESATVTKIEAKSKIS